jgi:L-ascorbate metabolism protein UlaG (beta-lactamase superfamily)
MNESEPDSQTRRCAMKNLLIGLAWACLCSASMAQDKPGGDPAKPDEVQGKKVVIRWYGQSFFHITTTQGTRIVIDPHAIEQYPRNLVQADLVLISHPHVDHSTLTPITNRDKAKILYGVKVEGRTQLPIPINEKFRDVQITSVPCFHDNESGMQRGRNTAFVLEFDGLRVCHLGDLGHMLSERQLRAIGTVDVLMIPIGGIYTINGSEAKELVKQIKPTRYILPMHYGTRVYEDLLDASEFIDGLKNVDKQLKTNEIDIDPTSKPPAEPRVVLLGWEKKRE